MGEGLAQRWLAVEQGTRPEEEFLFLQYHFNSDAVHQKSVFEKTWADREIAKQVYDAQQAHLKKALSSLQPQIHYSSCEVIRLPKKAVKTRAPLEQVVMKRRSLRRTERHDLSIENLAFLLENSVGITAKLVENETGLVHALRAAPSGGALYPIETYIVPLTVQRLPLDVYHYDPFEHALERLGKDISLNQVNSLFFDVDTVINSSAIILLTARFRRSSIKYGERSYRLILLEAGAILEHVGLASEAVDLRSVMLGGFMDAGVNSMLGCNGVDESVIVCGAVGKERPNP